MRRGHGVVKLIDRAGAEVSHAVYLRGGRIVDVGYGEVYFDSEDCASGASALAKLKEGCDPNAAKVSLLHCYEAWKVEDLEEDSE